MKFTIAPADLMNLLKSAGFTRPRKADTFTLSACAANRPILRKLSVILGWEACSGIITTGQHEIETAEAGIGQMT